jgi:hypothetical protein
MGLDDTAVQIIIAEAVMLTSVGLYFWWLWRKNRDSRSSEDS